MKKNGFTLAELLVSLGIIGIIAAIAVPAITNTTPDRYKTKVLEKYKEINKITSDLLGNDAIYYRKDPIAATANDFNANGTFNTTTQYGCIGLNCTERPTQTKYDSNAYTGICKYPNLVQSILQTQNGTQCTQNTRKSEFVSAGNYKWKIEAIDSSVANGYYITIDLDPSNDSVNCIYNASICKYPDRFAFKVDGNGDVTAAPYDALTTTYLQNMTRVDAKQDLEDANE